jgi:hypothetical protein
MFGPNVQLYAATHPIDIEPRRAGSELAYPITVPSLSYEMLKTDRRRLLDRRKRYYPGGRKYWERLCCWSGQRSHKRCGRLFRRSRQSSAAYQESHSSGNIIIIHPNPLENHYRASRIIPALFINETIYPKESGLCGLEEKKLDKQRSLPPSVILKAVRVFILGNNLLVSKTSTIPFFSLDSGNPHSLFDDFLPSARHVS